MFIKDITKALKRFSKEYGEFEVININGDLKRVTLKSNLRDVNQEYGYITFGKDYFLRPYNENEKLEYDLIFKVL